MCPTRVNVLFQLFFVSHLLDDVVAFMWCRRQMCFVGIASWPLSWLMHLWHAVAVPDMASEQSLEQHQRPEDSVVFVTVFVRVLSCFAPILVRRSLRVSWNVQCAK
jgi:hypothetical protein